MPKPSSRSTPQSQYFVDILHYLPSRVFAAVFAFLALPLLARNVTAAEFGEYSIVMALVSLMAVVLDWVTVACYRYYSSSQVSGRVDEFLATSACFFGATLALLGGSSLLLLMLTRHHLRPSLFQLIGAGIVLLSAQSTLGLLLGVLRASRRTVRYGIFYSLSSLLSFSGGSYLLLTGYGAFGFLIGYACGTLLVVAPLAVSFLRGTPISSKRPSVTLGISMFKYSWPLVLGEIGSWTIALSDRFVIEMFVGSAAVGVYSAAYSMPDRAMAFAITLFNLPFGPLLAKTWEERGKHETRKLVSEATRLYIILLLPMAVGISLLSRPLVQVVFPGVQYSAGYSVIPFVAASMFLFGLQQRFHSGLIVQKTTRPIMWAVLLSGASNLVLTVTLLPALGLIGAAIGTLGAYVTLFCLSVLFGRKALAWRFPFKTLARACCAAAPMAWAVLYFLEHSEATWFTLASASLLGGSVYLSVLFSIGGLSIRRSLA